MKLTVLMLLLKIMLIMMIIATTLVKGRLLIITIVISICSANEDLRPSLGTDEHPTRPKNTRIRIQGIFQVAFDFDAVRRPLRVARVLLVPASLDGGTILPCFHDVRWKVRERGEK